MATLPHEPPTVARQRPSWMELPAMWSSLAIAVVWLAVLFDGVFGPDIRVVTGGYPGSTTTVPSAVIVALFALLATGRIARQVSTTKSAPTEGIELTTAPAAIPHRHVPYRLIFAFVGVLAVAAVAVGIVLAVRDSGASSTGVKGSGVAVTQSRSVAGFTAVELAGANNVAVHVGSPQAVTVHGDDNLLEYVTTLVQDGTLAIGQTRSFSTKSPMSVEITVPALNAVTLSGAGVLNVDGVKAYDFSVRAPGIGTLSVAGTATTLDATATVSGTGRLLVNASRSLDATVSGVGSIVYTGSPSELTKNVTGTGAITGG